MHLLNYFHLISRKHRRISSRILPTIGLHLDEKKITRIEEKNLCPSSQDQAEMERRKRELECVIFFEISIFFF